ncbi:MAG: hypothetical protein IIA45_04470 [Bacteroidetes bacterium]|nr:hypothetical protein [Bacteroidota bacterium]
MDIISKLPEYYDSTSYSTKRKIAGSVFSENWVFDGKKHRTTKMNEALSLIANSINGFERTKKRPTKKKLSQSYMAPPSLKTSNQLIEDLKRIYELKPFIAVEPINGKKE